MRSHGNTAAYNNGCRCEPCRDSKRRAKASTRARQALDPNTDALTGGQWVPVDGISRWQYDHPTTRPVL